MTGLAFRVSHVRAGFAGVVVLLAGAGCASLSGAPPETPAVADGSLLESAASRAAAAFADLARARQGGHGAPATAPVSAVPPELGQSLGLDWVGPIDGVVAWLARRIGYGFRELGAPPVRPVMVVLRTGSARVIDLLQDAGFQAGTAALVEVDAANREIRLTYPVAEKPS